MHPFLDDPENKTVLWICNTAPGFIPIVIGGRLHPVREGSVADYPVPADLSAEDFVLGLLVLGCKLQRRPNGDIEVTEPRRWRSPAWLLRARQIQAVMTHDWEGRRTALSDYVHEMADR